MNTCAVQRVATLQVADHICIWDKARWPFKYTHHGVVYSAGASSDEIVIAHVWSRIEGFRESHADSSFRLTSLTEFLNGRPVSDMRRVQYNSSFVSDAFSKLGEVHRSRSDAPPVVIARCNFLLGQGRGHFSILTLNCEHVALWCKTGVVWSKQLFHKVSTKVPSPYHSRKDTQVAHALEQQLVKIRDECMARHAPLQLLDGKRVYLQCGPTRFVKKRFGSQLYVVLNDPSESDFAFRQTPTSFQLRVQVEAYNCVKVTFMDMETGAFMCAKTKAVKLLQKRSYHRENLFKFECGWNGELQSRRHRRWYVGAQMRDGLLRTFNIRDRAGQFQIVDADLVDKMSVPIDPSTITEATHTLDEEKADSLMSKLKRVMTEDADLSDDETTPSSTLGGRFLAR
jgi:hypothetical protein